MLNPLFDREVMVRLVPLRHFQRLGFLRIHRRPGHPHHQRGISSWWA